MVPPLEGFWWQDGVIGVDYANKDSFQWIPVFRLPDFVTKEDFDRAAKSQFIWVNVGSDNVRLPTPIKKRPSGLFFME